MPGAIAAEKTMTRVHLRQRWEANQALVWQSRCRWSVAPRRIVFYVLQKKARLCNAADLLALMAAVSARPLGRLGRSSRRVGSMHPEPFVTCIRLWRYSVDSDVGSHLQR